MVNLNKNYMFNNKNNNFTKSKLEILLENDKIIYNPIYICNKNKVDTNYLLNSFINNIKTKKVLYIDSDDLLEIYSEERLSIPNEFLNVDLLIVNNIEKLENKNDIQRKFLYLFTTLYKNEKQIIITSSKEINNLIIDNRLKSRFNAGLNLFI